MKRLGWMPLALALLAVFAAGFTLHAYLFPPWTVAGVQPVFSPDDAPAVLLAQIASADATLDVMLYQFSYAPLIDALVSASNRGVTVRVLLDRQIKSNLYTAERLALSGVRVQWASTEFASTHAKFVVVDGAAVFVGSTNWSRHAMELNREAGVLVRSVDVAQAFLTVFESDWGKATPWKRA
ncbi:MAG: phospholipase D-like domain-containing protein [Candidatus Micrarchaeota archaeon]|nr:phospholipase D-like domain-containing protein [Candidatus Micrarchaeota archaeon]